MSDRTGSYLVGLDGETAHASQIITGLESKPKRMRSHLVQLVTAEGIPA